MYCGLRWFVPDVVDGSVTLKIAFAFGALVGRLVRTVRKHSRNAVAAAAAAACCEHAGQRAEREHARERKLKRITGYLRRWW